MNIDQDLLTEYNPTLTLTINDLDLAGMVLGWLVLQYFWQNLVFNHVGFSYNSISAVAWAYKGIMSTSLPAGRLLRLLYIRKRSRQIFSLVPQQISGYYHVMMDIPSRDFNQGGFFCAQSYLVTYFNPRFSLPQTHSYQE